MSSLRFSTLSLLFSLTDEEAMWRVQTQDDPRAFAQLVRRWEGHIRDLCARMTGDPHTGEDLTQEAFARVFAKRASYRQSARFSTWLWRIALNVCYDELRRRQHRSDVPGCDAWRQALPIVPLRSDLPSDFRPVVALQFLAHRRRDVAALW